MCRVSSGTGGVCLSQYWAGDQESQYQRSCDPVQCGWGRLDQCHYTLVCSEQWSQSPSTGQVRRRVQAQPGEWGSLEAGAEFDPGAAAPLKEEVQDEPSRSA